METQKIIVAGRVQGVGFRWSASQLAQQIGLTGTVRNRRDGQVELIATGSADQLAQLVVQLKRGLTPWIVVDRLSVTPLPLHKFSDFQIII
ncbi:acylphosphatase [Levilactobacillus paucivorans]|uniref:acylphosphatase n=1 Tax=Levilactobacillus paucivorans TaxID=616990 RepID=UPI00070C43B9|nr:acylphosphatase [Levilactobacillus paucivorans]